MHCAILIVISIFICMYFQIVIQLFGYSAASVT